MAERLLDWTVDGNRVLSMNRYNSDKEAEVETLATFDLKELPQEMTDALEAYGAKQKLADSGASAVGDVDGKVELATKKFDELKEGKWVGERVNATGAAENRKLASTAKTMSKVVSLEGLMAKNMFYPDTMTEDDHKKLAEFMAIKVKADAKAKK